MNRPRSLAISLLALGLTIWSGLAGGSSITLRNPGYLWLDGRYYVYDMPLTPGGSAAGPAVLAPTGQGGFHFSAFVTARNCSRGPAGAVPPGLGLTHSEHVQDTVTRVPITPTGMPPLRRIRFAACSHAVTIMIESATGDLRCAGAIPPPFAPGECPQTERADRRILFSSGFER
jgi:hypothetical protein